MVAFEWDDANRAHLARHRIKVAEAEEVFRNDPVIQGHDTVDAEDRWAALGAMLSLRVLVLIFTIRNDRIRVVTGWDADKRTQKTYFTQ